MHTKVNCGSIERVREWFLWFENVDSNSCDMLASETGNIDY